MKLFVCEKPSQAKDIAPHVGARQRRPGVIYGDGVAVTWCIGHLLEQARPEHYNVDLKSWDLSLLPVLPDRWHLDIKASTKDQYHVVARLLKQAEEVVIATDADREGEVIAREVLQRVGYIGPVRRLWLGALDAASIQTALTRLLPGDKTQSLYLSGLGRARADWLAGMNMTMALTAAFGAYGRGGVLHCGRVQTPVLALIVRREREIQRFKPKPYYVLQASFEIRGAMLPMRWKANANRLDSDGHCIDHTYVGSVATKVRGRAGRVTRLETNREHELPPLLYSLGSLQRDASARFGMKAQVVLDICQSLYERHKATTYPRTDCEYLPASMAADAPVVLNALLEVDPSLSGLLARATIGPPGRVFNDRKVTAHHAIIPTSNRAIRIEEMKPEEWAVYDLIRRRYLAQFMGHREFDRTVLEVMCEGEAFTATGESTLHLGWKVAYVDLDARGAKSGALAVEVDEGTTATVPIPKIAEGDVAINHRSELAAMKTKPPKRYTEGTLIAVMESIDKIIEDPRLKNVMRAKEKAGIGTEATRASIIEGLFKREYIAMEMRAIAPTKKAHSLIAIMEKFAPELADPVLTALWEDQLMQIEGGVLQLEAFEQRLGQWLHALIARIRSQAQLSSRPLKPPGSTHACPNCGKPLRPRKGARGSFWGCSAYPECNTALPDVDGKPVEVVSRPADPTPSVVATGFAAGAPCPLCKQGQLQLRALKDTRKRFWGCSGFPGCKLFAWAQ